MNPIIFYSWQSDLPNSSNRGLIQQVLEVAVKSIREDETIKVEPVVDRDTAGVPGSPAIDETIFSKIDRCAVFVGDVSIINQGSGGRPTPNPNVLVELGYAAKSLGWDRILMIQNEAYGDPTQLPFDLRRRRAVTYKVTSTMPPEKQKIERKALEGKLKRALRGILEEVELREATASSGTEVETPEQIIKRIILDDSKEIEVHELVNSEVENIYGNIVGDSPGDLGATITEEEALRRVERYESLSRALESCIAIGAYFGPDRYNHLWTRALERIGNLPHPVAGVAYFEEWEKLRRYPALRTFYAGGIAALAKNRYSTLRNVMTEPKFHEERKILPLMLLLPTSDVLKVGNMLPGMERNHTPGSDRLYATLREGLRTIIPNDSEYERLFDRFEFLFSMVFADLRVERGKFFWFPVGRYGWRRPELYKEIGQEIATMGADWPPLKAGFFQGSYDRLKEIKVEVDRRVIGVTDRWIF